MAYDALDETPSYALSVPQAEQCPASCIYSNFKCILKLKSHISENVSEDFKGKVKRIFKGFTMQG